MSDMICFGSELFRLRAEMVSDFLLPMLYVCIALFRVLKTFSRDDLLVRYKFNRPSVRERK